MSSNKRGRSRAARDFGRQVICKMFWLASDASIDFWNTSLFLGIVSDLEDDTIGTFCVGISKNFYPVKFFCLFFIRLKV
jgi:hypothetical protein